jgi:hypothetical protein
MRTTVTIEDDVLDKAKSVASKLHEPFRKVINEALRAGLDVVNEPTKRRAYCTQPHKMGLRTGRNLDNMQELLAQVEGDDICAYDRAKARRDEAIPLEQAVKELRRNT